MNNLNINGLNVFEINNVKLQPGTCLKKKMTVCCAYLRAEGESER